MRLSWSPAQPDSTLARRRGCAPPAGGCCWRSGAGPRPCRACAAGRLRWAVTCNRDVGRPFSAFQAAPARQPMQVGRCHYARPCCCLAAHGRAAAARLRCPDAAAAWNPAADYITAGQDEPGYRSWYLALAGAHEPGQGVQRLSGHLSGRRHRADLAAAAHRDGVAEMRRQPFEVPPTAEWPHIVQTLRYVHDYVVPAVGPVEAGVGLSQPGPERVRGRSARKRAQALFGDRPGAAAADHARGADADLVRDARAARRPITRSGSASTPSCASTSTRPSIRRWNMDPAVAAHCPPIVHPEDIATVGQPLPQPAPVQSPNTVPPPQPQTVPARLRIVPPPPKPSPNAA